MDFHSLSRRELQSLCKLNKIPANITNVAMADALQALEIVKGIEEFMDVSKPETADLVESVDKVGAVSPKAQNTRCRTSTRQKVKIIEPENMPPAAGRSTRRGNKQSAGEVEESKNEVLKTPAVSTSRRRAPETLSCRNVNSQLNECEKEAKEEGKLQTGCRTRRSTRLTEKKSTEPRVKKESGKAVKIDSFDEVNIESEEVKVIPENTVGSEVEEICDAFEKLDVVIMNEEEKEDICELTNTTSNPSEDEMAVVEGDVNSVLEEVVDEAKEECGEKDILKKELANETSITTSKPSEDEMVVEEGDVNSVLEVVEDEMVLEEAKENCFEKDISKNESTYETSNQCEDDIVVEEGHVTVEEVLDEAKEDCGEIDILKKESIIETSILCDNGDLEEKLKMGEKDDEEPESDGSSCPFEFQNLEQKLDIEDAASGDNLIAVSDHNLVMVEDESPDSNDILNPFEVDNLDQKIDLDDKTFNASEAENSIEVINQENNSDFILDHDSLESGAEDSLGSTELFHKDENLEHFVGSEAKNLCAFKEQIQVPEINGSSIDMVIDNTEMPIVMEEESENTVDIIPPVDPKQEEHFTEMPIVMEEESKSTVDKPEEHFTETTKNVKAGEVNNVSIGEFRVPAAPCFFKTAAPLKNMSIVTDDKENIVSARKVQIDFVDDGKKIKKEEKIESTNLNEMSIRQLRKQLKLLTLSKEGATARPALQILCGNQLAGGEPKN